MYTLACMSGVICSQTWGLIYTYTIDVRCLMKCVSSQNNENKTEFLSAWHSMSQTNRHLPPLFECCRVYTLVLRAWWSHKMAERLTSLCWSPIKVERSQSNPRRSPFVTRRHDFWWLSVCNWDKLNGFDIFCLPMQVLSLGTMCSLSKRAFHFF